MKHAEAQEATLARMAQTRAALVEAYVADEPLRVTRVPRLTPPKTASAPWFLQTPNTELIALGLVALAVLGLRRTVQTAVGAGLSASTHRALADLFNALRG
ncbi:hypothetical protein BSCH_01408c [Candidatus Paraburkholderia schumanniana]|nr:hypothetical protein BSCH_01408c [Candidatus Paraburkholderia schumannianae]